MLSTSVLLSTSETEFPAVAIFCSVVSFGEIFVFFVNHEKFGTEFSEFLFPKQSHGQFEDFGERGFIIKLFLNLLIIITRNTTSKEVH